MLLPILALLIATVTGIDRTWDGNLAVLAQQRANEITGDFTHRLMPELAGYRWGEVIAWNRNAADPYAYAVSQWQGSLDHWAILTDRTYRFTGCAEAVTDAHYIVCLVTDRGYVAAGTVLTDTAMEDPMTLTNQPVAVSAAIGGVISTGIALGAVLWPDRLTPELQAVIIAFANSLIIAGVSVWAASKVTPVANPTLPSGSVVHVQGTEDKVEIAATPPGPIGIEGDF